MVHNLQDIFCINIKVNPLKLQISKSFWLHYTFALNFTSSDKNPDETDTLHLMIHHKSLLWSIIFPFFVLWFILEGFAFITLAVFYQNSFIWFYLLQTSISFPSTLVTYWKIPDNLNVFKKTNLFKQKQFTHCSHPLTPTSGNQPSVLCNQELGYLFICLVLDSIYKKDNKVGLSHFTWFNAFKFHICCCKCQDFLIFYGFCWIIFHFVYMRCVCVHIFV